MKVRQQLRVEMHDIAMRPASKPCQTFTLRGLYEQDGVERAYAGIVAGISALARKLAGEDPYKSSNGPDALMSFADQLEGIVAAIGADKAEIVRFSVCDKNTRQEHT